MHKKKKTDQFLSRRSMKNNSFVSLLVSVVGLPLSGKGDQVQLDVWESMLGSPGHDSISMLCDFLENCCMQNLNQHHRFCLGHAPALEQARRLSNHPVSVGFVRIYGLVCGPLHFSRSCMYQFALILLENLVLLWCRVFSWRCVVCYGFVETARFT